jgi:hypothetical protein
VKVRVLTRGGRETTKQAGTVAIPRQAEAEVANVVDAILKIHSSIERMISFRWGLSRIKELLPVLSSDNFS